MTSATVDLPVGFESGGEWHRTARLHTPTGEDELAIDAGTRIAALEATELLSRCVDQFGIALASSAEVVRSLAVGDREALLLHLRRLTFGERIASVLACPQCGQRMDIDVGIAELLAPPAGQGGETDHELNVTAHTGAYRVRFRLPNGEDQERVAPVALVDISRAGRWILERCVQSATCDGVAVRADELPETVVVALIARMAELDPQAETQIALTCPSCAADFVVEFDAWTYFSRELGFRREDLLREIHLLALHYNWSESDILRLPRDRRRVYLGQLAEHFGWDRA